MPSEGVVSGLMVITRAVGAAIADCELTFLEREPIDPVAAARQHEGYCAALRDAGATVVVLPAEDHLPDAVFVEDVAVVLDEVAIVARPGVEIRRREVSALAHVLAGHRPTVQVEAPATLEGGDVLRVGREVFVGMSSRTNRAGFDQLSELLHPHGYRTSPVAVHGCLHLKTAVTALSQDTLLINPRWIDTGPLSRFRHLEVPEAEPFAANSLTLNGVVHLSARSARTRERVDQAGYTTRSLDIRELEKAEAGLTCMSLVFGADQLP